MSRALPTRPHCMVLAVLLLATTGPKGRADEFGEVIRAVHTRLFELKKPHAHKVHAVESYAKQIDWLEHKIDTYGSVVPKMPDIWGQARLTKHREEYEQQMASQLGEFKDTLQGSIRRSDQSYLALAFSLNAAAGGATVPTANNAQSLLFYREGDKPIPTDPIQRAGLVTQQTDPLANFKVGELSLEPTIVLAQRSRYLNHLNELRRINEGDDTSDAPGYALYLARLPISVLPGKHTESGYGAEVTFTIVPQLSEELLPTTFRNLVINDLADHLSLIVTKALEDRKTIEHLREWMEIVDAIDWEKIDAFRLSMTEHFREEVERQVEADLLAHFPATHFEGAEPVHELRRHIRLKIIDDIIVEARRLNQIQHDTKDQRHRQKGTHAELERNQLDASRLIASASTLSAPRLTLRFIQEQALANITLRRSRNRAMPFPPSQNADVFGDFHVLTHIILAVYEQLRSDVVTLSQVHLPDVHAVLSDELGSAYDFLSLPESLSLWQRCGPQLANAIRARKRWLDLHQKHGAPGPSYGPENYTHDPSIRLLRLDFFEHVDRRYYRASHTATTSLAWAILCEAALLNQALADDMARVAIEKGCSCTTPEQYRFYLPRPLPFTEDLTAEGVLSSVYVKNENKPGAVKAVEDIQRIYAQHVSDLQVASQAFNEYVRCRWPVVVFALDPVTDDQNIADAFSRRREMQLAVAVAVANGNVSPSAAGRFVRRLETDIETVALNRTAVGFSHGNDTFGWRFYPRVQTPPFRSNLRTFTETLIGPRPDQDLRARKLEAGIRECYAIVIMPSFVPYASFISRSNWFGLANPAKKELTLNDAMQLSRTFQAVYQFAQCAQECGQYRPGNVAHLTRVVDQLSRRMPFSDHLVQVPYENTVGGFELFATGVTDLGPELLGFYGAPGVNLDVRPVDAAVSVDPKMLPAGKTATVDGTTLFLVGNHFSVTNSRVIAGGRHVPYRLLSRQIMEVLIPPNVNPLPRTRPGGVTEQVVDVHVATPYGVTNHLLIPAFRSTDPKTAEIEQRVKRLESSNFDLDPAEVTFTFQYKTNGSLDATTIQPAGDPALKVKYTEATPANAEAKAPTKATIVLLPRKKEGTAVVKEIPVATEDPLLFESKNRDHIPVPLPKLDELVQKLVVAQGNAPTLNGYANGGQSTLTMVAEMYVRPDTDSRIRRVDQLLTIKLVERKKAADKQNPPTSKTPGTQSAPQQQEDAPAAPLEPAMLPLNSPR